MGTILLTRSLREGDRITAPTDFGTRLVPVTVVAVESDAEECTVHFLLPDGTPEYLFAAPDDTWTAVA